MNVKLTAATEADLLRCRLKRFTPVLYFRIDGNSLVVVGLFTSGEDESDLQNRGLL